MISLYLAMKLNILTTSKELQQKDFGDVTCACGCPNTECRKTKIEKLCLGPLKQWTKHETMFCLSEYEVISSKKYSIFSTIQSH